MSVQANDLGLYERNAEGWWDEDARAFRSLRAMKGHHLRILGELVAGDAAGLRVIDLGCGGGLLSVPLGRGGRQVVGIDRSAASLTAAAQAARREGASSRFVRADLLRAPFVDGCADLVLLCDVIEHVEDARRAIAEASRLLRAGGLLFVNTINRTAWARILAVGLAERIGLVPRGTHDPRLFVAPAELSEYARDAGLELVRFEGEAPRLFVTLRTWAIHVRRARGLRVSYNAIFRRRSAA